MTLGTSNKVIAVVDNTVIHALQKTIPTYNLPPSATEGDVVPALHNSLIGVKPFADVGCIRIFHPHKGGVSIHQQSDVHNKYLVTPIIKGVKENQDSGKYLSPTTPHMIMEA